MDTGTGPGLGNAKWVHRRNDGRTASLPPGERFCLQDSRKPCRDAHRTPH